MIERTDIFIFIAAAAMFNLIAAQSPALLVLTIPMTIAVPTIVLGYWTIWERKLGPLYVKKHPICTYGLGDAIESEQKERDKKTYNPDPKAGEIPTSAIVAFFILQI